MKRYESNAPEYERTGKVRKDPSLCPPHLNTVSQTDTFHGVLYSTRTCSDCLNVLETHTFGPNPEDNTQVIWPRS